MKIIKSYIKGFTKTLSSLGMAALLYVLTLFVGLTITLPFKSALSKVVGNSKLPNLLVQDFNFTAYEDIIRNYGDSLKPFIQIMFWFGLVYLVLSIFFAGGILNVFINNKNKFSMKSFFEGCGKYFLRFLILFGIIILVNIILALAVYIPLGMVFSSVFETVESETSLFYIGLSGFVIHLFFLILTLIISDYTKIKLVTEESTKVFSAFWQAVKFTLRHLFGTHTLFSIQLVFPILLFIMYYFTDSLVGMSSGTTIIIMFIVQQVFVYLRVINKMWLYGSQISYYNFFTKSKKPKIIETNKEEWNLNDLIDSDDDLLEGDLIA